MPTVHRASIDGSALSYFTEVGLDLEATREHFAGQVEREVAEVNAALTQAEQQRVRAEERLAWVKRDYQDGNLHSDPEQNAAEWREQREQLESEREDAVDDATTLRARADQIEAEGAAMDAEQEMLAYLADLRAPVASRVRDAGSVDAVRVVLLRLFDGFSLHSLAEPQEEQPPLPDGWVRSRLYVHPDLLVPGKGGFLIEPHPRREAILDHDKEMEFPQLERVPIAGRLRVNASSR